MGFTDQSLRRWNGDTESKVARGERNLRITFLKTTPYQVF